MPFREFGCLGWGSNHLASFLELKSPHAVRYPIGACKSSCKELPWEQAQERACQPELRLLTKATRVWPGLRLRSPDMPFQPMSSLTVTCRRRAMPYSVSPRRTLYVMRRPPSDAAC